MLKRRTKNEQASNDEKDENTVDKNDKICSFETIYIRNKTSNFVEKCNEWKNKFQMELDEN